MGCIIRLFLWCLLFQFINIDLLAQKDSAAPTTETTIAKKNVIKSTVQIKDTNSNKTIDTTLTQLDSTVATTDSLPKDTVVVIKKSADTATYAAVIFHQYMPPPGERVFEIMPVKGKQAREEVFYTIVGLLFLLGLIIATFNSYVTAMFSLFVQTAYRQQQTKESLLQDSAPSFLMNLFFVLSGGLIVALYCEKYQWFNASFFVLYLYSSLILACIYIFKYLFLNFMAWVFNIQQAAAAYIFTTFQINKILGILLVPFILVVAYAKLPINLAATYVLIGLTALLILYRYGVTVGNVRKALKINAIHFFLYLCSIEIIPMLVLYKVLFNFITTRTI